MTAPAATAGGADGPVDDWAVLAHRAPQLAATMRRYLAQFDPDEIDAWLDTKRVPCGPRAS